MGGRSLGPLAPGLNFILHSGFFFVEGFEGSLGHLGSRQTAPQVTYEDPGPGAVLCVVSVTSRGVSWVGDSSLGVVEAGISLGSTSRGSQSFRGKPRGCLEEENQSE